MSKKVVKVLLSMTFPNNESGAAQAVYSEFHNIFNEMKLKNNYGKIMIKGGIKYQVNTVRDAEQAVSSLSANNLTSSTICSASRTVLTWYFMPPLIIIFP